MMCRAPIIQSPSTSVSVLVNRPVIVDPAWLTPAVKQLATSIYSERTFDRLPTLASALEDAGCTNADLLDHSRQPGEHVRGCWALDILLKKKC